MNDARSGWVNVLSGGSGEERWFCSAAVLHEQLPKVHPEQEEPQKNLGEEKGWSSEDEVKE